MKTVFMKMLESLLDLDEQLSMGITNYAAIGDREEK